MRGDTHARLTLVIGMVVGLVPVRSWERGGIDTPTMAVRLVVAILVTWAVLMVLGRVVAGYRSGGDQPEAGDRPEAGDDGRRRRSEDLAGAGGRAPERRG